MSVLSVCEFAMIFVIKYFVDRDSRNTRLAEGKNGSESGAIRREESHAEDVRIEGKRSDSE